MKHLSILLATILLVTSCGKNTTTIVESTYNDSDIKAKQILQDARIKALEDSLNAFETDFDMVVIDYNSRLNNLDTNFTNLHTTLNYNIAVITSMLADLSTKQITPIKICASNEYMLKTSEGMFAVYMVSNNFGTYMGKLAEQTNYATTDTVRANFKIVNSQIVCL